MLRCLVVSIILLLSTSGCRFRSTSAQTKSDGIEFQVQPINAEYVDCGSIILRGTERFKGTYYVMPRALIGTNKSGDRSFAVSKLANGNYALQIGLYFPSKFQDINLSDGGVLKGCDTIAVQNYINDESTRNKEVAKVSFFDQLPVKKITVNIAGVEQTFSMGKDGDDIFNYTGQENIALFELTAEQLQNVVTFITNGVGLEISLGFDFSARRSQAFSKVSLNSRDILTALKSRVKVDQKIADFDLRANLQMLMSTKVLKIYSEGNIDDEGYSDISQKLVDQFMAENPAMVMKTTRKKKSSSNDDSMSDDNGDLDDDSDSDSNSDSDTNTDGDGNFIFEPYDYDGIFKKGKPDPAITQATADAGSPAGTAKAKSGEKTLLSSINAIDVNILLKHLDSSKSYEFTYSKMGDNSEVKYRTSAILKGNLSVSDVQKLELRSGTKQVRQKSSTFLQKGDRLILAPVSKQEYKIKYAREKVFFNIAELKTHRSRLNFPQLQWTRNLYETGKNSTTSSSSPASPSTETVQPSEGLSQVGLRRAYIWDGWTINIFNYQYYVWGKITTSRHTATLTKSDDNLTYSSAPISISSDKFTARPLSELASKGVSDYIKSTVDKQGRVEIEILQDLGRLEFSNNDKFPKAAGHQFPNQKQASYEVEYFQEKLSTFSDRVLEYQSDPTASIEGDFPASESVVQLNLISVQTTQDKVPVFTLEKSNKPDQPIVVY